MKSFSIAFSGTIAVLFAFLAFECAPAAMAQTFRGSIQGTITDSSGAVVPGAQVKVISKAIGFSRTLEANDRGEYVASELPLGTYSVTVEMNGFRTTTLTQVPVSVGSPTRADVKLSAGAISEVVEVNASVPMVETASNTMGGTIEAIEAAELPINGRDYTKLLELVPGASSDPVGSTESAGSYGLFSLNGNRGRSNNYLLDGTDMNDGYRNLSPAGAWRRTVTSASGTKPMCIRWFCTDSGRSRPTRTPLSPTFSSLKTLNYWTPMAAQKAKTWKYD